MKDIKDKARELYEKYNIEGLQVYIDRKEKHHFSLSPKEFALKEINEVIILDRKHSKFWNQVKAELIEMY